MIYMENFKVEHYKSLEGNEPEDPVIRGLINDQHLTDIEKSGYSRTFFNKEGEVIACVAAIEKWPGRAEAWAVVSEKASIHVFSLSKGMKNLLDNLPFTRVEAVVADNFGKGCRLVRILGFELEGHLKKYFPNGTGVFLYSRIKNG